MEPWILCQAILLVESFKLVPRPLDEGPRPKKWQIEAKPTWHLFCKENECSLNTHTHMHM
jgi:hypothetical protein